MGGTAKTTTAMSIPQRPARMTFMGDRILALRKMAMQAALLTIPKKPKISIATAQLNVHWMKLSRWPLVAFVPFKLELLAAVMAKWLGNGEKR